MLIWHEKAPLVTLVRGLLGIADVRLVKETRMLTGYLIRVITVIKNLSTQAVSFCTIGIKEATTAVHLWELNVEHNQFVQVISLQTQMCFCTCVRVTDVGCHSNSPSMLRDSMGLKATPFIQIIPALSFRVAGFSSPLTQREGVSCFGGDMEVFGWG